MNGDSTTPPGRSRGGTTGQPSGAHPATPDAGARGDSAPEPLLPSPAAEDAPDTVRLPWAGDAASRTARLPSAGDAAPHTVPLPPPADAGPGGYSATVLGSHWFERPAADGSTGRADAATARVGVPAGGGTLRAAPGAVPDRVEGEVLRFGPGVTAVVRQRGGAATPAGVWHGTPGGGADTPGGAPGGRTRRGRPAWRRYAPAAVILAAVLVFLAWQRFGPGVEVRGVSVQGPAEGPGCDGTADVTALVETNGRAGTIAYRWQRSDGTSSGTLYETVTRGQRQARLHLGWTFTGRGAYAARAEVRIDSPGRHSAAAEFVYDCR